jgi:hypothetical protein
MPKCISFSEKYDRSIVLVENLELKIKEKYGRGLTPGH